MKHAHSHRHSHTALIAARARHHRFHLSPSEAALWRAIRSGKLLGVRFCRQVAIPGSRFIADFLAPAQRVIVEVDGLYHARRRRTDARRDLKLQRLGYRVLRVPAEEVEQNLPAVLARLAAALAAR